MSISGPHKRLIALADPALRAMHNFNQGVLANQVLDKGRRLLYCLEKGARRSPEPFLATFVPAFGDTWAVTKRIKP